jgi:hypothetical protein
MDLGWAAAMVTTPRMKDDSPATQEADMRKLTLSKETLRVLDDQALTLVAGGGGDSSENSHHDDHKKKNHPNSGHAKDKFSHCPGQK